MHLSMKKLSINILLLIIIGGFAHAKPKNLFLSPLYDFFPKVSEMEGGESRWLVTDVIESVEAEYAVLNRSYSSYNRDPKKIWDIQRKKSFKVDLKVIYARNFLTAESLYQKRIKRKVRFKKPVGFGDQGYMLVSPIKGKYPDAVYELIFMDKSFVVSLTSEDGFALMDFADYIESKISGYVLQNFDRFFIKKLRLSVVSKSQQLHQEELTFVEEDLKELLIEGHVFDESNAGVPFVDVRLDDFDLTSTTDESGYYRFKLPFKGKNNVALLRNMIIQNETKESFESNSQILDIEMTYQMNSLKKDEFQLKTTTYQGAKPINVFHEKDGYVHQAIKYKEAGGTISFVKDCSGGRAFRCIQIFKGTVSGNTASGTWMGTGGGGKWQGQLLGMVETVSTDECRLQQVKIDTSGKIVEESDDLMISYGETANRYIKINCNMERLKSFYTQSIGLTLTHLTSDSSGSIPLFLYNISEDDGVIKVGQSRKAVEVTHQDEPYQVLIDLTDQVQHTNQSSFLIGGPVTTDLVGNSRFANRLNYSLIRPKIHVVSFGNGVNIEQATYVPAVIGLSSGKDFASNSSVGRPDGKSDMHVQIQNFEKSGTISFLEIKNTGTFLFKWNTNRFDLYPGLEVEATDDGKVKNTGIFVKKGETIDIFMYKPEELNTDNIKLSYRMKLNDEWITGDIPFADTN